MPHTAPDSLIPSFPSWKVDLHLHCAEDLEDAVQFSAAELLFRAHQLGFSAVAFTLHSYFFSRPELHALARELGLLLISGIELRIDGADVIVLNVTAEEAAAVCSFSDLRKLREKRGEGIFIFAPHPFYFGGSSIGGERLLEQIDLFDAIEQCHFHTSWIDPNRAAQVFARAHGKPMLATSDAHRLSGFGRHYTEIRPLPGEPLTAQTLFAALRCGRGEPVSPPVSLPAFISYALWIVLVHDMRVHLERW